MNEMININDLKEKYWAGETSLAEERELRDYFEQHPEEQGPEQSLFAFFNAEKKVSYNRTVKMPQPWIKKLTHRLIPLAASLMLLAGSIWGIHHYTKSASNEVIIDDPQTALQVTREAFALLNGKVDRGEQALKDNMVHLDKTLIFKNL